MPKVDLILVRRVSGFDLKLLLAKDEAYLQLATVIRVANEPMRWRVSAMFLTRIAEEFRMVVKEALFDLFARNAMPFS